MTITRLVVKDFGVFAGEQIVDLGEVDLARPIALIGGENGRGKTTLLEALFVVLYGKLSPHIRKGGLPYERYLSSRVNDSSDNGVAHVALWFRISMNGRPTELEVHRSWTKDVTRQTERFWVVRDGFEDDGLSDNWTVFWPGMLPVEIAELFFFDGERIEALADPEMSSRVIRESLNALFGISPIARLRSDLDIVQKKSIRDSPDDGSDMLSSAYESYVEQRKVVESLEADCDELNNSLAGKRDDLEKITRQLGSMGGSDVLKGRQDARKRLANLRQAILEYEEKMRSLASELTPLLLIPEIMQRTAALVDDQHNAQVEEERRQLSEAYQEELCRLLAQHPAEVAVPATDTVREFFASESSAYSAQHRMSGFPKDLADDYRSWPGLIERLDGIRDNVRALLAEHERLVREAAREDSHLEALPSEESVQEFLEQEARLQREIEDAEEALQSLRVQIEGQRAIREQLQNKYATVAEEALKKRSRRSDRDRVIAHATRTQKVLDELTRRLVRHHLSKLEIELTEKLALLHSKRLVHTVRIVPDSFQIELSDSHGRVVPSARLSAGERQLLALAVVWAVQSYSDRKMPMVIDTPLGRLDIAHRRNMVERFLSQASHQVIVLSTDSEVTPELADAVNEFIGAQFLLQYDVDRRATNIQPGYFGAIESEEYERQQA